MTSDPRQSGMDFRSCVLAVLLLAALTVGCGRASPGLRTDDARDASTPSATAPQRQLVIAFSAEPDSLETTLTAGSGARDYVALGNSFLAYLTPRQQPMPFLADRLPTVEDGTWKLLPDGRMETTYRLRSPATWHDGHPITAGDFVFAHRVRTDPDLPMRGVIESRVSSAVALDDATLFLDWKEPYLWAGAISPSYFSPLPSHLLERLYVNDKAAFANGAHWRAEWVGSGPYRLESWQPGVEMAFRAHAGFVFGKPRIDRIVLQLIADANAVVASLLSETADVAFNATIDMPQALALEQVGWTGSVEYWRGNPRFLSFQMRDWGNLQRATLDVRVRRAMLHAIDRQAIVDGLYSGKTRPYHVWLDAGDPAFPAVDRAATKYEFDVARAEALLAEGGWVRSPDGTARHATGQALDMPILNQPGSLEQLEAEVIANNWKGVGISSPIQALTRATINDTELRTKFAAVSYDRNNFGYDTFPWLEVRVSTPQNRWSGSNRNGYVNTTVNDLWTRAVGTIDEREREPLFVEALKAMTQDAVVTPTHLQPRPMAYRKGLTGPKETWVGEPAKLWNIWEWSWGAEAP